MKKKSILFLLLLVIAALSYGLYNGNFSSSQHSPFDQKLSNSNKEEKVYIDSEGLFKFAYPGYVSISEFVETDLNGAERKIILGREEENRADFQVAVSSFSDGDPITDKKIKKDIPDQIIREAQNIQVKGALGVAFISSPEGAQDIREVWFSHNGFLYQISALSEMDQIVAHMIDTWVWGEE